MRKPLERWLRRFSQWAQAQAIKELDSPARSMLKADAPDLERLKAELTEILNRWGLRQMERAANVGAATVNARVSITDELILDFFRQKEIKVVEIMDATLRASQKAIRQIIEEALLEEVRPSTTEIGRRLRNRLNFGTTEDGSSYAFSPERAQLIARTEMVQAQNTGIVNGYKLSGIKYHKWISYQDGRSGRGHDHANGQVQPIDGMFEINDPDPPPGQSGTVYLRYPGDPDAPIRHTANCRCTTIPVVSESDGGR